MLSTSGPWKRPFAWWQLSRAPRTARPAHSGRRSAAGVAGRDGCHGEVVWKQGASKMELFERVCYTMCWCHPKIDRQLNLDWKLFRSIVLALSLHCSLTSSCSRCLMLDGWNCLQVWPGALALLGHVYDARCLSDHLRNVFGHPQEMVMTQTCSTTNLRACHSPNHLLGFLV